jgi:exopolyphosphatase/guanosine-5'-triphosphate,3'-diphosphate pyrophosphatase
VFFATLLGDPPLFADVRQSAVRNLAAQYDTDFAHAEHVVRLSLELWDALAEAGLHRGDPKERQLLWATAMLHDIGTAVDYDDHHKHSRYLILSAGLPGYSPREVGLIGQAVRYHRKGDPGLGQFSSLAREGDEELLYRIAASVRIAEQLERSRDQAVTAFDVRLDNGRVELRLEATEDVTVARWATERQGDVFRRAFGRDLSVS